MGGPDKREGEDDGGEGVQIDELTSPREPKSVEGLIATMRNNPVFGNGVLLLIQQNSPLEERVNAIRMNDLAVWLSQITGALNMGSPVVDNNCDQVPGKESVNIYLMGVYWGTVRSDEGLFTKEEFLAKATKVIQEKMPN